MREFLLVLLSCLAVANLTYAVVSATHGETMALFYLAFAALWTKKAVEVWRT